MHSHKKGKRRLKTVLYGCLGLAVLLLAVAAGYCDMLRPFYTDAERSFRNPDRNSAFDEQGIAYDEDSGLFLFSGYMKDHEASPVYLVDPKSGQTVKRLSLLMEDGSAFTGHSGGIAVSHSRVYIAGSTDDCIYVYDKGDILQAEDGASVPCRGVFPLATAKEDGVRASFLASSDDGILYVGEFHLDWIPQLRCRRNHAFRPETGRTNALLVGFRMDDTLPLGLEQTPCVAYCLPNRVQGAAFLNGKLFLSRSFGASPSRIASYALSAREETAVMTLLGEEIAVYGLPEATDTIRAFPLTEGITVAEERIYIASELMRFLPRRLWKAFDCDWCFSMPVLE